MHYSIAVANQFGNLLQLGLTVSFVLPGIKLNWYQERNCQIAKFKNPLIKRYNPTLEVLGHHVSVPPLHYSHFNPAV